MLWEELTSGEFPGACEKAKETCIIPFGVYEKHGNHLPLGTDMMIARKIARETAELEPVVVFPDYYFGQISEARHVPGTISTSPGLVYDLLENVCAEISRNGFKKIILLNSHGGNSNFISYFIQSTLYKKADYAVFHIFADPDREDKAEIEKAMGTDHFGEHAGNFETSLIMSIRPEGVKMDAVEKEGLVNYGLLNHLNDAFTGIWWYADHPTHAAGEPYAASARAGEKAVQLMAKRIARVVKTIKEDQTVIRLQDEFYKKSGMPV